MSQFLIYALEFLLVLPAIILHEVSHGYVAYLLGDTTAKDRGRLSLNPVKHVDPWGTLAMPALLLLMTRGQAAFGYAKPVPINPNRFRDYRVGMFLTGIAGPCTNLALAIVSGLLVRFLNPLSGGIALDYTVTGLFYFCLINLSLMMFNLIPIPPLDGSRVLPLFLSNQALRTYHQIERYGFAILLAVLWFVPQIFHVDPIGAYLSFTVEPLLRLLVGA